MHPNKFLAALATVAVIHAHEITGYALSPCPNTEFLGNGYNVIKGNPLSQTTDPGFQFQFIYKQTYTQNTTMGLGCLVPDDVTIVPTPSCSYTSEFVSATSAYDYQQSLQKQVTFSESAGFDMFGESFTASHTFQSWFSDENNSSSAYLTSVASCTAYFAELPSFVWNPQFTTNFIGAVEQLSNETAFEFVEAFGTHYVSSMNMGGNSLFYYEFDQESLSTLSQTYSSSEIAGGVELGLWAKVGGSISGSQYSSVYQYIKTQAISSGFWGIPFPAPQCSTSSCDASSWAEKIQLPNGNPFPHQYTLKPITDFLTPNFFPNDKEIGEKQSMLIQYLNGTYCKDVDGCFTPSKPTPPPFQTTPQVTAGNFHSCGLMKNGTAVCWGCGTSGGCSGGNFPNFNANYGQCDVPPNAVFTQISAGYAHTCGILVGGVTICWGCGGNQNNGQCNVPSGTTFTQISAGQSLTCGILTNGSATCWGENGWGEASPPQGLSFIQITTYDVVSCGILVNGEPVCWGNDIPGGVVPPGLILDQISTADTCTCGTNSDGSATCWGENFSGQLNIPPGQNFKQMTLGEWQACGLTEEGQAFCWGGGQYGQINVPPGVSFLQISAGYASTCALMQNGEIVCWGCGSNGFCTENFGQCQVPPIIF